MAAHMTQGSFLGCLFVFLFLSLLTLSYLKDHKYRNYINSLIDTVRAIRESTKDVLKTFEADNVRYLELRVTPREIYVHEDLDDNPNVLPNGLSYISKERYVETVLVAIDDHQMIEEHNMHVKLILSVDRGESAEEANETLKVALHFQKCGVVGLDLCGSPLASNFTTYEPVFIKARKSQLGTTLHFADTKAVSENPELRLLLGIKSDRLSHLVWAKVEFKQKHGTGLELCLSSDVHSELKGNYAEHPLGEWRKAYKSIALCIGDYANVFQTSLSHEYYLAAKHFGISRAELVDLAENAIALIFEEPRSDDTSRLPTVLAKKQLSDMFKDFRESYLSLSELQEYLRLKQERGDSLVGLDAIDLALLNLGVLEGDQGQQAESMSGKEDHSINEKQEESMSGYSADQESLSRK